MKKTKNCVKNKAASSMEKKERFYAKEEGAAVVEAAVIVPMILVILMGMIFFLFFLLDMAVIKSETVRAANELAEEWKQEKHRSVGEQESLMKERINKRLTLSKLDQSDITLSFGKVVATAKVDFFLASKGLSFTACGKAAVDNREQWVRILSH